MYRKLELWEPRKEIWNVTQLKDSGGKMGGDGEMGRDGGRWIEKGWGKNENVNESWVATKVNAR